MEYLQHFLAKLQSLLQLVVKQSAAERTVLRRREPDELLADAKRHAAEEIANEFGVSI